MLFRSGSCIGMFSSIIIKCSGECACGVAGVAIFLRLCSDRPLDDAVKAVLGMLASTVMLEPPAISKWWYVLSLCVSCDIASSVGSPPSTTSMSTPVTAIVITTKAATISRVTSGCCALDAVAVAVEGFAGAVVAFALALVLIGAV